MSAIELLEKLATTPGMTMDSLSASEQATIQHYLNGQNTPNNPNLHITEPDKEPSPEPDKEPSPEPDKDNKVH